MHVQQQQQRFFNNNNNNNFNQRQRQPMMMNNNHLVQQRPMQQQQPQRPMQQQQQMSMPQQQAQPAVNPFIPLQASRKATKTKNVQGGESKKPLQVKESNKPHKEVKQEPKAPVEAPVVPQETENLNVSTSKPAIDNRKCRLAISFGK